MATRDKSPIMIQSPVQMCINNPDGSSPCAVSRGACTAVWIDLKGPHGGSLGCEYCQCICGGKKLPPTQSLEQEKYFSPF